MKKIGFLIIIIIFICVSFVFAQEAQTFEKTRGSQAPMRNPRASESAAQGLTPRLFDILNSDKITEIGLTKEQDEQVNKIVSELKIKESDYDKQIKEAIETARKVSMQRDTEKRNANEVITKLLTPEQLEKIKELNIAQREKMQQKMQEDWKRREQNRQQGQQQRQQQRPQFDQRQEGKQK